jgi:hypothetical protein
MAGESSNTAFDIQIFFVSKLKRARIIDLGGLKAPGNCTKSQDPILITP